MRTLKYCLLCILSLLMWSCDEDEPNPIECKISYKISSLSFSVGDHLIVTDFTITPILPSSGINIQKIEFFLGNKKIASSSFPPYELDYEIPDLPEGEHLLQIDVHLEANNYDKTTVWLRRNIEINKPQIIE